MDVRTAEKESSFSTEAVITKGPKVYPTWNKPFYYIAAFGGPDGPYAEKLKDRAGEKMDGMVNQDWFNNGILFFIFLNTIALASDHHETEHCDRPLPSALCQSASYEGTMGYFEMLFNAVFTLECLMKITGMGFKAYIRPAFNQLDFFIVVTSILDMIGEAFEEEGEGGGSIFKIFRVFRLFRVRQQHRQERRAFLF